ncbi:MAG: hypothetical protein ABR512_11850 [Desulfopila sp.]
MPRSKNKFFFYDNAIPADSLNIEVMLPAAEWFRWCKRIDVFRVRFCDKWADIVAVEEKILPSSWRDRLLLREISGFFAMIIAPGGGDMSLRPDPAASAEMAK